MGNMIHSSRRSHNVTEIGEGERILPSAIPDKFVTATATGALEPLTEGSTGPIASAVTLAGICQVKRYAFSMP